MNYTERRNSRRNKTKNGTKIFLSPPRRLRLLSVQRRVDFRPEAIEEEGTALLRCLHRRLSRQVPRDRRTGKQQQNKFF